MNLTVTKVIMTAMGLAQPLVAEIGTFSWSDFDFATLQTLFKGGQQCLPPKLSG